jgi:hypothetical protein
MDFAEQFKQTNDLIRGVKMQMAARRSFAIQARSKIKPTIMNPSLMVMSKLRGGDGVDTAAPLELYYPSATLSSDLSRSGINPNIQCQQKGGEWFGPSKGCLRDGEQI